MDKFKVLAGDFEDGLTGKIDKTLWHQKTRLWLLYNPRGKGKLFGSKWLQYSLEEDVATFRLASDDDRENLQSSECEVLVEIEFEDGLRALASMSSRLYTNLRGLRTAADFSRKGHGSEPNPSQPQHSRGWLVVLAFAAVGFLVLYAQHAEMARDDARLAALKIENPTQYLAELRERNQKEWLSELEVIRPDQYRAEIDKIAVAKAKEEEAKRREEAASLQQKR